MKGLKPLQPFSIRSFPIHSPEADQELLARSADNPIFDFPTSFEIAYGYESYQQPKTKVLLSGIKSSPSVHIRQQTSLFMFNRLPYLLSFLYYIHVALPAYGTFEAGAHCIDISPQSLPAIRNGGFTEERWNEIIDPLHARCFVFQSNEESIAIAVVDSCMIPRDICEQAKHLAYEKTGIPPDHILITSTHTHSAPSVMDFCLGTSSDPQYKKYLPEKIAEGIFRAQRNLEPARIGSIIIDAPEHTHNRRWLKQPDQYSKDPFGDITVRAMMHPGHKNTTYLEEAGPTDSALSILSIQATQDNRPIGFLANYSMHYFGTKAGFSADYYGRFCQLIEEKVGTPKTTGKAPFVAALSQGTSGDQQWKDYSKPAKANYNIDDYTRELGAIALTGYKQIAYEEGIPKLAMKESVINLNRRLPDEQRIQWAQEQNEKRGDLRPRNAVEVYAEQAIWLNENPQEKIVLQAIQIGAAVILAAPNEMYGITGLKLKAQSPYQTTIVMGLSNGAAGYIPPPEQHYLGGYTTWPARTAGLEVDAEPKIVEALLNLIEKLDQRKRRPLLHDFYNEEQRKAINEAIADQNNHSNRGFAQKGTSENPTH